MRASEIFTTGLMIVGVALASTVPPADGAIVHRNAGRANPEQTRKASDDANVKQSEQRNLTSPAAENEPKFSCDRLEGKSLYEIYFSRIGLSREKVAEQEQCVWPAEVKPTKPRDPATCICDDIGELLYHRFLAWKDPAYLVPASFEDFRAWDCVRVKAF